MSIRGSKLAQTKKEFKENSTLNKKIDSTESKTTNNIEELNNYKVNNIEDVNFEKIKSLEHELSENKKLKENLEIQLALLREENEKLQ